MITMRIYSDPSRESDPMTLPDVEVFAVSPTEAIYNRQNADHADEFTIFDAGWYYWYCFPGCMPDSSPFGPFKTEEEAIADCQEHATC